MKNDEWVIVDTETTGLSQPISVVEIAAQRMNGWDPAGEPFRVLLNHDVPMDPGAEAVHGYSREYLRKHGLDPRVAHAEFNRYCGDLPIVAYNISFDWDRALMPEYRRLKVPQTGVRGFCALALARRTITETTNLKLSTLKEHFRLSEAPSHRGLNDVLTLVALFQAVFRDRLELAGISGFEELAKFSKSSPIAVCLTRLRVAFSGR